MDNSSVEVNRFRGYDGLQDIADGVGARKLWMLLAWSDIKQRYRRSVIGPFWITISMAIFIAVLGVIYSEIFNMEISVYLPYVAAGLIAWGFISGTIIESCNTFVESAGIIKQIKLPFAAYCIRTVWRNLIILGHTIVLMIPIILIFRLHVDFKILLVIPGIAIIFLNQVWLSIIVSILSTRYRDIPQLIGTAVQITMLATPIMWPVSALGEKTYIANLNPAYHFVEVIRRPLINELPSLLSWEVVLAFSFIGFIAAMLLMQRAMRRIVYWL